MADANNNRIQKWSSGASSGVTVAGGNGAGYANNRLNFPTCVAVSATGNIYIADENNDRVQKWVPGATTGITIAGGNGQGNDNNQFNWTTYNLGTNLFVDNDSDIYVTDGGNDRLQKFAQYGNSIKTTYVPSNRGAYRAVVIFQNGCMATSNTISTLKPVVPTVPICIVTVDSVTGKNMVVWEKPTTDLIDNFVVYKETTVAGTYSQIGEQSFSDYSTFLDTSSNPEVEASSYKLGLIDTCGKLTPLSNQHTTVHLTLNIGTGGVVNLIWSAYQGINFGSYNIYRGTTPSNLSLLTTIQSSSSSYTDLNPPTGNVYYVIEVVGASCNPTRSIIGSRSNITNTASAGINEHGAHKCAVFPNPTSEYVNVNFSNEYSSHQIVITDVTGRILQNQITNKQNPQLDLKALSPGVYLIKLANENEVFKIVKQ